jgi:hypothetical protein
MFPNVGIAIVSEQRRVGFCLTPLLAITLIDNFDVPERKLRAKL